MLCLIICWYTYSTRYEFAMIIPTAAYNSFAEHAVWYLGFTYLLNLVILLQECLVA